VIQEFYMNLLQCTHRPIICSGGSEKDVTQKYLHPLFIQGKSSSCIDKSKGKKTKYKKRDLYHFSVDEFRHTK
jgi:hypothetical protein